MPLSPQQFADDALQSWQAARERGLTPAQRMEELWWDFLIPPAPCITEYEATLRIVSEQMGEAA